MYYNTNNEIGNTLKQSEIKATRQEDIVQEYFTKSNWHTPESVMVEENARGNVAPITSWRRAFSVLKNKNIIEKSDRKVKGMYNKEIYVWKRADA